MGVFLSSSDRIVPSTIDRGRLVRQGPRKLATERTNEKRQRSTSRTVLKGKRSLLRAGERVQACTRSLSLSCRKIFKERYPVNPSCGPENHLIANAHVPPLSTRSLAKRAYSGAHPGQLWWRFDNQPGVDAY